MSAYAAGPNRRNCVESALQATGMVTLGACRTDRQNPLFHSIAEFIPESGGFMILAGNAGSAMWQCFQNDDGVTSGPDPLNHWTQSRIAVIAEKLDARAVYPFGGPPWHPFTRWALHTGAVSPSPLGLTLHPQYGLWHAFRAALLFEEEVPGFENTPEPSPCDTCRTRPCLHACPIGAFTEAGYDHDACRSFVAGDRGASCAGTGCQARHACPIGQDYAYDHAHAAFHMTAFTGTAHGGN